MDFNLDIFTDACNILSEFLSFFFGRVLSVQNGDDFIFFPIISSSAVSPHLSDLRAADN